MHGLQLGLRLQKFNQVWVTAHLQFDPPGDHIISLLLGLREPGWVGETWSVVGAVGCQHGLDMAMIWVQF